MNPFHNLTFSHPGIEVPLAFTAAVLAGWAALLSKSLSLVLCFPARIGKMKRRKPEDGQVCPLCSAPLAGTEEEMSRHVEQCLFKVASEPRLPKHANTLSPLLKLSLAQTHTHTASLFTPKPGLLGCTHTHTHSPQSPGSQNTHTLSVSLLLT